VSQNAPSRVDTDRILALIISHRNVRLLGRIRDGVKDKDASPRVRRMVKVYFHTRRVRNHPRLSQEASDTPNKHANNIRCHSIHAMSRGAKKKLDQATTGLHCQQHDDWPLSSLFGHSSGFPVFELGLSAGIESGVDDKTRNDHSTLAIP
jgi:hypothetical protein